MAAHFEIPLCVRGYHVYEAIWMPVIGENLECERQLDKICMIRMPFESSKKVQQTLLATFLGRSAPRVHCSYEEMELYGAELLGREDIPVT